MKIMRKHPRTGEVTFIDVIHTPTYTVVIATEPIDNPGCKISEALPELEGWLRQQVNIDVSKTTFFEHWFEHPDTGGERFFLVTWEPGDEGDARRIVSKEECSKERVELLVGFGNDMFPLWRRAGEYRKGIPMGGGRL